MARKKARRRSEAKILLLGTWNIVSSEELDLEHEPPGDSKIVFEKRDLGSLVFGCLQAQIDWRGSESTNGTTVEFTLVGFEEGDEVMGRGRAVVSEDGCLRGKLYYHLGDEFTFTACREG